MVFWGLEIGAAPVFRAGYRFGVGGISRPCFFMISINASSDFSMGRKFPGRYPRVILKGVQSDLFF